MNLIERARIFAIAAHSAKGQVRKYTNEPYWHHSQNVAGLVESVSHTDEMIAAAWLHDVVEDTDVTIETIRLEFGDNVAELVNWLTDVSRPSDGNRAVRKAIDREHTAQSPAEAQTVKFADIIDNVSSIVKYDPSFAKVYLEEKKLLIDVMVTGDQSLRDTALTYIGEFNVQGRVEELD